MSAKSKTASEPPTRRRLGVDQRREQLMALGMELFSTRAYEGIRVEEIAERAGVSRGLLYHYFPTKRDFYVAVTRAAAAELRELTEPDHELAPSERLRAGIDAFLRQAERRSQGFLTAYRGSLAGDPEVRAIVEEGRQRQAGRILEIVAEDDPPRLLRMAVRGWIALAQDVTARWLEEREPQREQIREMLITALGGAISGAAQADASVEAALRTSGVAGQDPAGDPERRVSQR